MKKRQYDATNEITSISQYKAKYNLQTKPKYVPSGTKRKTKAKGQGKGQAKPKEANNAMQSLDLFRYKLYHNFIQCKQYAYYFIITLLERIHSSSKDIRKILHLLLTDLFTALYLPNWPSAQMLIDILAIQYVKILDDEADKVHSSTILKNIAIESLGKIITQIKLHDKKRLNSSKSILTLKQRKKEINPNAIPTDQEEDATCICGYLNKDNDQSTNTPNIDYSQEFMLDCDDCHSWFHGICVGIKQHANLTNSVWYCDSCYIRRAAEQRYNQNQLFINFDLDLEQQGMKMKFF